MLRKFLGLGIGISLVASSLMADLEKKNVNIGFIALTDCAPIVIGKEKGFFKKMAYRLESLKRVQVGLVFSKK